MNDSTICLVLLLLTIAIVIGLAACVSVCP